MNMNDYRRKNGTGKSEDPKYHDTDDMNIYGNSGNDKHVPLSSPRSREPLPSTLEHARMTTSPTAVARTVPFARFEGITPRRSSKNVCMCCMRCTLVRLESELSMHVAPLLPCHRHVGTRYPRSPHHPCMTRSCHFLLHRCLNELSEPEHRRGTILLSSPWHPFCFRHDDKMLHNALINIFFKIA